MPQDSTATAATYCHSSGGNAARRRTPLPGRSASDADLEPVADAIIEGRGSMFS